MLATPLGILGKVLWGRNLEKGKRTGNRDMKREKMSGCGQGLWGPGPTCDLNL